MTIASELNLTIPAPYLNKKTLTEPELGADKTLMFGVELEIENINMNIGPNGSVVPGLTVTEDGSLRNNGYEFVTKPMFLRELAYVLNQFFLKNKFNANNYSDRTSVHVHANVGDMTWEQVKTLLLIYITFERVLFKFIGDDRDKNIYCVPMYDTVMSADLIKGDNMDVVNKWKRWEKYTALNLLPIFTQTTVEFRHMAGTHDVNKIIMWCHLINQMFSYAKKYSLEETKAFFLELNTTSAYREALFRVFGEHANMLLAIGGVEAAMEEGVLFTKYSLGIIGEKFVNSSNKFFMRIPEQGQAVLPNRIRWVASGPNLTFALENMRRAYVDNVARYNQFYEGAVEAGRRIQIIEDVNTRNAWVNQYNAYVDEITRLTLVIRDLVDNRNVGI